MHLLSSLLGFTQKAALACGSNGTLRFVYSFFTPKVKKEYTKREIRGMRKSYL
jgi:hypothetical protein